MGFADSIKKVIGIEELDEDEMITEEEVSAAKEKLAKEAAPRRSFGAALIGYIHYEAPEEEQNFSTLLEMINRKKKG